MVKHTQNIRRLLPWNYLSVFDYFVELALKWLRLNSTGFEFRNGFIKWDGNRNRIAMVSCIPNIHVIIVRSSMKLFKFALVNRLQ